MASGSQPPEGQANVGRSRRESTARTKFPEETDNIYHADESGTPVEFIYPKPPAGHTTSSENLIVY